MGGGGTNGGGWRGCSGSQNCGISRGGFVEMPCVEVCECGAQVGGTGTGTGCQNYGISSGTS